MTDKLPFDRRSQRVSEEDLQSIVNVHHGERFTKDKQNHAVQYILKVALDLQDERTRVAELEEELSDTQDRAEAYAIRCDKYNTLREAVLKFILKSNKENLGNILKLAKDGPLRGPERSGDEKLQR